MRRARTIVKALLAVALAKYRHVFWFEHEPPLHLNCRCVAIPIEDLE
jgi:hypothetical protein